MMDDDDDGLIINGSRVLADTHSYEYEYGKGLFTTARYSTGAVPYGTWTVDACRPLRITYDEHTSKSSR